MRHRETGAGRSMMTDRELVLREATARDVRRIAQLHIASWQATYTSELPSGFLARQDPVAHAAGSGTCCMKSATECGGHRMRAFIGALSVILAL